MPEILRAVNQDEIRDWDRIELTPKQDKFIFAHVDDDETKPLIRFAGYGGGVGNGKSFSGCIITDNHCQDWPGALALVGRRHATDLIDSTLKDFLSMYGDHGIYQDKYKTFKYPNGSEVIFRHLDDLRSLTNMNLSMFWIDQAEEVPFEAFQFLRGRIRRKKGLTGKPINERIGRITYNMEGHNWIYYLFHRRVDVKEKIPIENPEQYINITATSLENPHLTEDYKADLMSAPKEWRDRFVFGAWDDFAGQIFSEWRPGVHIIDPFPIPNHWERFRSIDHGQNNPTACGWYAVDYDGNIFKYQEYYEEKMVVSEHVKNILEMSKVPTADGRMVMDEYSYTLIDPSTHAKTREKDGRLYSVADEYYDAGLVTTKAQNDVMAGINRFKEYLTINPERYHPTRLDTEGNPMKGSPKFFIFRGRCPNFEEEVQGYKWKPLKYGVDENNKEQPVKKNDHAVDESRYAIMSRPQTPGTQQHIDPHIMGNVLELARYASRQGMTVQDLLISRMTGDTTIQHSDSGIVHQEGGISHTFNEDA